MAKKSLLKRAIGWLDVPKRRARARKVLELELLRSRIETEANRADGLFDANWYLTAYPDVADERRDPFQHYVKFGHKEGRNPGPNFDNDFYKSMYSDIVEHGLVPLVHYVDDGRAEGRIPNAAALPQVRIRMVRSTCAKPLDFASGGDIAVFVTHAPAGRLKPHVLAHMRLLGESGVVTLLVVVVDRPLELLDEEIAAAAGIIVRDNAGYDFGAWAHAFEIYPEIYGARLLIMTNDSIIPNARIDVYHAMMHRIRENPADIVALTASHEYGWHTQSFFMALKARALASWGFQHWMRGIERLDDKDAIIRAYEVPFAARMRAAGLTVEAIYRGQFSANPTFFSWRDLIEQGFPFIKLLMLRKAFAASVPDHLDVAAEIEANWQDVCSRAGFDVDLIRNAVRSADYGGVASGGQTALLVDQKRFAAIAADRPLRVAFIGPWNYDVGLGAASREIICALRRLDVELNLYPIEAPFHIHRPICPPIETTDFGGQADIAVIHLNPDGWHVLTAEQRAIIDAARHRIGYWVWETDTVPPYWGPSLRAVDRIWAPSHYCAEVFAEQIGLPVDVVPHAVTVPEHIPAERGAILSRFGIAADTGVILYIFDGASYLVRKNPHGLIRGFAASGLAAKGWVLLLKTKHLYDRPEAGEELAALAAATTGVVLADTSLASGEVTALMAAADIYASPHSSEGFGLTVAEAMAVGKPVVATDYSGPRDFLDETCGYPVAWTRSVLTEDHGHYLKGHGWATIDEAALADALMRAAAAVEAGDVRIAEAAQARIASDLSYDAVSRTIAASFAATIASDRSALSDGISRPKPPVPPSPIGVNLAAGQRMAKMPASDGVVPVPLGSDLAWNGSSPPPGKPTDWLFFAPADAFIAPAAADFVRAAAGMRPDAVLFYGDDVATGGEPLDRIRLKPDFDRTLLLAQDYIGAPVIVRRSAYDAFGGLNRARGSAALYDLVLRLAEAGRSIARIPQVLVGFEGERPCAQTADRHKALAAIGWAGDGEIVAGAAPGLLAARWRFTAATAPHVAICVPTRRTRRSDGRGTYIETLLAGIAAADWPKDRLTVIIGDDIPGTPEWANADWPFELVRIETPRAAHEPFNYAAKMNRLWRAVSGDAVVFMNDDVTPHGTFWLHALMGFAMQKSVGGVGARLIYESGALQHAGITPAFGTVVHAFLAMAPDAHTYQDWGIAQREWSMVTGAVFAGRRAVLEQLGGFDEAFSLEFNDVDLCLRIRNLGYRIVCTPDAEFTHAEKASRGETIPPGAEVALFLARWARWLDRDPASHPGFHRDRVDLVPAPPHNAWYR